MTVIVKLAWLLTIDAIFIGLCIAALVPLFVFKRAAFAVTKRNFVGYFSNPTGYVFLCMFVALSSFAAFWPHEFFAANLANLDQLNIFLPYIMLVFIPAITMSIWSEERRQGTDELLLTLPAGDFDIVIGKYLAAAAIFTASLLFSQIANFTVLVSLALGDIDLGLFCATYLGYWLTGLAMLSVGMVASFLTKNLTIGFILGLIFNLPLVFMKWADVIIPSRGIEWLATTDLARVISDWSVAAQFEAFGRGVISLSSLVYFSMIILMGLYLSMVLIGARHWYGGRKGHSLFGHYLLRTIALVVLAFSLTIFFTKHDFIRRDVTDTKVSSLSYDTKRLVRDLKSDSPIYIDAFISRDVPGEYVKTRRDLVSMLKEIEAMAGDKIRVNLHGNLEPFSREAALAEEQYGIVAANLQSRSRGTVKDQETILGAAFRCGLQKVVVPFFDYGIPVEYELIRSINTVAQKDRKRLGVVRTEAYMLGGVTFSGGTPRQVGRQAIIAELEKQYDVEEVVLDQPIDKNRFDVLMAVQPSSLSPEELSLLIDAIEAGVPTAIFEDPLPMIRFWQFYIPGTGVPKQAPGGMMGAPPLPKADIRELWAVLGIESQGSVGQNGLYQPDLVWQKGTPYPKLQIQGIPDEWVFVREEPDEEAGLINPDDDITSGLDEVFFPYAGLIEPDTRSSLKFTKLVKTRELAGVIGFEDLVRYQTDRAMLRSSQRRRPNITLAARIEGLLNDPGGESASADSEDGKAENEEQAAEGKPRVRVVYVADIDVMAPGFVRLRARPNEEQSIQWKFENVTFLLNIIDELSGDTEYIDIRKRKTKFSTLKIVEARVEEARAREYIEEVKFRENYNQAAEQADMQQTENRRKLESIVEDLQKKQKEGQEINEIELREKIQRLKEQQQVLDRRVANEKQRLQRERDRDMARIQRDVDLEIQQIQSVYKAWAVAVPWIPPALVGVIVFVRRRLREREGIEKSRLV
jgi:ABC-2 type transport system permease protein